jgi:survival of motor neuron protein-interacting protein 1
MIKRSNITIFYLQGYWFYALLVSLDKPLIPDACSLLRGLARACSRLRASLVSIKL